MPKRSVYTLPSFTDFAINEVRLLSSLKDKLRLLARPILYQISVSYVYQVCRVNTQKLLQFVELLSSPHRL